MFIFASLGLTYGFPDALPDTVEHRVSHRLPKLLTTEHKQGASMLSVCSGSRQVSYRTLGYAVADRVSAFGGYSMS